NLTLSSSVKTVGEAWQPGKSAAGVSERGMEALSRAWMISNTSLLVPVGLALLVCYYVFSALTHELTNVRSETAKVQAERTKVINALVDQNAKISNWLIGHANSTDSNSKALNELLLILSKARTGDSGSTSPAPTSR